VKNLFDEVTTKSADKLRLSHGDVVAESQLSIAVAAPRPDITVARQRQRVLRADRHVVDKMTSDRQHLLRSVVTACT